MAITPTRAVNLARQLVTITAAMPSAEGRVHRGELVCTMRIQPSPASRAYTVRLAYRHATPPSITVTDPPLELHPDAKKLPHVFIGDKLCLYYRGEWKHHMLLAHTVVPWISEWLMHYELWLVTGRWAGGGHTHAVQQPQ